MISSLSSLYPLSFFKTSQNKQNETTMKIHKKHRHIHTQICDNTKSETVIYSNANDLKQTETNRVKPLPGSSGFQDLHFILSTPRHCPIWS